MVFFHELFRKKWTGCRNRNFKFITLILLAITSTESIQCNAKEALSPFEESIDSLPRTTDPVQILLMSSINHTDPEPSDSLKSKRVRVEKKEASIEEPYRLKVVLDPGHGGKDDGAVGRFGIREKQVSLNLAKKVKREIERSAKIQGYPIEVLLTRSDDIFIPLKERASKANAWSADLFVSIHLNSSPVSKARGFEVYFLSPEASDPETERLALKESEGQLPTQKSDVLNILSDVRTTFHTNESAQFAEEMFSSISKKVLSNGRGVRQGPFTVLHGTNMPAILVEVGYVTHPQESYFLTKEAYLKRLANAISSGIIEFGIRTKKLG